MIYETKAYFLASAASTVQTLKVGGTTVTLAEVVGATLMGATTGVYSNLTPAATTTPGTTQIGFMGSSTNPSATLYLNAAPVSGFPLFVYAVPSTNLRQQT